jgi:hypothetical protein
MMTAVHDRCCRNEHADRAASMAASVLIVDDDPSILNLVAEILVCWLSSGKLRMNAGGRDRL